MIKTILALFSFSTGAFAIPVQPLPEFNSTYVLIRRADAGVESDSKRSCSFRTAQFDLVQFNCTKGLGIGSGLEIRVIGRDGSVKTPNLSWVQGSIIRYQDRGVYWTGPQCPSVDFCNQIGSELRRGVKVQTEFSRYRTPIGTEIIQVNLDLDI